MCVHDVNEIDIIYVHCVQYVYAVDCFTLKFYALYTF